MSSNYVLSYTAVSLSFYESEIIANLFLETLDWQSVEQKVIEDNILQKGSIATRKREFIELKKRLETLTPEQIAFYLQLFLFQILKSQPFYLMLFKML